MAGYWARMVAVWDPVSSSLPQNGASFYVASLLFYSGTKSDMEKVYEQSMEKVYAFSCTTNTKMTRLEMMDINFTDEQIK